MARRDQGQRVGKHLGEALMRARRDQLFALVGRGRNPHLTTRCEARELGELAPVGRQRRRVELDVAGDQDARRAERGETSGALPHLRNDRSLIRPLIIARRDFERFSSTIIFGQSSLSATSVASGRQRLMNRRTNTGLSSGAYWCTAPAGRRCASIAAEVTVVVVTSAVAPMRVMRSTNGSRPPPSPPPRASHPKKR